MSDEIEKFKMMVDMAKENGRQESVCNMQESELARLRAEIEKINQEMADKEQSARSRLEKEQSAKSKLEKKCQKLEDRIKELELELARSPKEESSQGPTIVVSNFIVLSKPKTAQYVSQLDDNGRMFACHLLANTMPDACTLNDYDTIKQITQLGGIAREQQLTDALKETATRPTTVIQNVESLTKIPSVANYQPQIETQHIDTPALTTDLENQNLLE